MRGFIARHIDTGEAIERGHDVAALQSQFHVSFERPVQTLLIAIPLAIPIMNVIYIWGHVPFLAAELIWLRLKSDRWFAILRNALVLSALPSLVLYVVLPTAPPRLNPALRLVDTVAGPDHSNYGIQPAIFANHFAAIPSMHVGWALLAGLAAYMAIRAPRWRWLALAMPVAMAISVMSTANHYLLDWVIGCLIAVAAFAGALAWQKRRDKAVPTVTIGPNLI